MGNLGTKYLQDRVPNQNNHESTNRNKARIYKCIVCLAIFVDGGRDCISQYLFTITRHDKLDRANTKEKKKSYIEIGNISVFCIAVE